VRLRSRGGSPTIESAFDWQSNGLNAVRLMLASGVIIWHSFPLTGRSIEFLPLRQLLAEGWVDGFFAASGFLIVASWVRRPDWVAFLTARVLRIMPAFWTCLIMTGFLFVPLVLLIANIALPAGYWASAASYLSSNALLRMHQYDIAGTPFGVPLAGTWNGSLWTLWWEFLCYLAVMALGVLRLTQRRWSLELVFLFAFAGSVLVGAGVVENYYYVNAARFGVMFAAGALIYRHRARIPVNWTLAVLSVVLVGAAAWLPNYRVVAAIPLAYLVIVFGAVLRHPAFRLRNDISYGVYVYAFPVQQALAVLGLQLLPPLVFAAAAVRPTVLLAAGSWWLVEKPSLRLRRPVTTLIARFRPQRPEPSPTAEVHRDN
jgi:peptidoglycan/LPS O-acetylase OafA/YrhL